MNERPTATKRSVFTGYHLGIAAVVVLFALVAYKLRQPEEQDDTPDHGLARLSALTQEDLDGRWAVYASSIDHAVKQACEGNVDAIRCVVHLQSIRMDASLGGRTFSVAVAQPDLLYKVLDEHNDTLVLGFLKGLSTQCWDRFGQEAPGTRVRIQAFIGETEEEHNAYMSKWLIECFEEDMLAPVEEVRKVCMSALAYMRRRWAEPKGKSSSPTLDTEGPAQLVRNLGTSRDKDPSTSVKKLHRYGREAVSLLLAELKVIASTGPANDEWNHMVWSEMALRSITGQYFKFRSNEKLPKGLAEFRSQEDELGYTMFWMSRAKRYVAPKDVQAKVIEEWKKWIAQHGKTFEVQEFKRGGKWYW